MMNDMAEDTSAYGANLQGFLEKIRSATVEEILFSIDNDPTFKMEELPFRFRYCHAIKIVTRAASIVIHPSATDSGLDTFWVDPDPRNNWSFNSSMEVGMKVTSARVRIGYDGLAFVIELYFETRRFFIYVGEIYGQIDGKWDIKINDEMLLVLDDPKDIELFEELADCR
jgi:hypothetical protein